ncbi:PP2C family serine/threonine-protein phosphatase [Halalkalibacterium halodurans]|jgi:negative regulator of sigma-B (phosphoserine phosphatase)|uniref:PPM-type phosphatase domain-containing protein n=1 Tax=Halalkalibacterium halodurans TaxID=86665 RepID=A0A0M0KDW2_ALKHA|nr:PP2C family serine/threonine-protein phosphatase [Halalkalibacterium halodurans]MED3645871.1 PP2C family serine/threonine-protein phosphatase [Halalkalibacterium halodurans]MED4161589.1 PP2C family serine/threonine-protein phosphatase [Halalkalibacterium halodurans]TES54450.1 indirect negative regulator of sigma-B activity [Halalkalibacterium halodurans]TPE69836.1 indirect negative regulator of sigma-B activity [Halalkalibacterium halodurans]
MVETYNHERATIVVWQRTKKGNDCCGDAHVVVNQDEYTLCAVVDGLGSGQGASESALAAVQTIKEHAAENLPTIMERCNESLFSKRGAVLTILKIDYLQQHIKYTNIGNVCFHLCAPSGKRVRPLPVQGYLSGKKDLTVEEKVFPYEEGSVFILHSDGVKDEKFLLYSVLDSTVTPDLFIEMLEEKGSTDDLTILVGKLSKPARSE